MDEEYMVCVCICVCVCVCIVEYYSAINKNENFVICNNMDRLEKDKYCMYSFICRF